MIKELVSVVVPVFNGEDTIERCLDSALSQDGVACEVIVIDDGSSDGTPTILREKYRDKVRYLRQENAGPAAARNHGINEARGEFVAFLDADDEWIPGKLQIQLAALVANPAAGFCFSDISHWEEGNEVHLSYLHECCFRYASGGAIYEHLLHECFVFTPTVVVPRAVLENVGGFNETLRIAEDYDLWLRIANVYSAIFIDRPLLRRHRNGQNLTNNLLLYAENSVCMMEQVLSLQERNSPYESIIRKRLSVMHNDAGYHHRKMGSHLLAREHYLKSLARSLNYIAVKGLLFLAYQQMCQKKRI